MASEMVWDPVTLKMIPKTSTVPGLLETPTVPPTSSPTGSTGLFGLGTTDQWGTAMGLGGLAMKAIALPQQMEYYGAQTDLAKQQLASNRQAMEDRKLFNSNWANASNSVIGGGLASRSAQGV